jgi:desumoylating isopeptidase 1
MSNALAIPLVATHYLGNETFRQRFTSILLKALLSTDKTIVTCAAGVAFGAIGKAISDRSDFIDSTQTHLINEDWEIEMASAIVEAIDREKSNADVGKSPRDNIFRRKVLMILSLL